MYHRTLHVALFGLDDGAGRAIRSVPCPDRFEVRFDAYSAFDADAFAASDIAILDLPELVHPGTFLPHVKTGLKIVLRATEIEAAQLDDADLAILHDIWLKPMPPMLVAFRFRKIIEGEKSLADLSLAQQYLDTAIDSIPELVWFKDARGSHLKVNSAFCKTVEKTKEQIEGRGHYYIWNITPEEYSQGEYVCLESEEQTMTARKTCLFDEQIKATHGMRQFKTYKSPLFDYDGSVMGTVGIAHDVTDLGNIETELEIFINSMPYAIIVLNTENSIININEKAEEYFGVKRGSVVDGDFDRWRRLVLGDAVVNSHDFSDSSFFTAVIGEREKTFEVNQRDIVDVFGNKTGQLRIYRDVTKERELEQRVLKSANTDYLTGLYNRRYLYERLSDHLGSPVTLVYLDLDDFKSINDDYGHQRGDRMLVETSSILVEAFPNDTCVRMGGDEFVVAIFGLQDVGSIEGRAHACLDAIRTRFAEDSAPGRTTGSMGIAADEGGILSIDELIRRSDEALYEAKRAGKSQCRIWTPSALAGSDGALFRTTQTGDFAKPLVDL